MKLITKPLELILMTAALGVAQQPPPAPAAPPAAPQPMAAPAAPQPAARPHSPAPPAMRAFRAPVERELLPGPAGRWWNNPELAQKLNLTADQQKKMDDIFQQHRLKLIDLNASLEKEEVTLEPLVQSDQPDESRIVAQIDRVAQARAELEKANARMLLGIRRVLNQEQWKRLQAERRPQEPPPGDAPPPPQPRPRR